MRFPTSKDEIEREYKLARKLGLIKADETPESRYKSFKASKYGITSMSYEAFVMHEIAIFRTRYQVEDKSIGPFSEIDPSDYNNCFQYYLSAYTRYFDDPFTLSEIKDLTERKIRERDYEKLLLQQ